MPTRTVRLAVVGKEEAVIKHPIDKTLWIQRGLAALVLLILLFFVLAPASRAIEMSPTIGNTDRLFQRPCYRRPAQCHFHTPTKGDIRVQTRQPS